MHFHNSRAVNYHCVSIHVQLIRTFKKMTENGENNAKKARMEDDPFRWPGYTGEAYPEMCDIRAMPPQPKDSELKPGQLPEKLIKQYFEEVCSFFST